MSWWDFPVLSLLKEFVYVYNDLFFECWKKLSCKKTVVFILGGYWFSNSTSSIFIISLFLFPHRLIFVVCVFLVTYQFYWFSIFWHKVLHFFYHFPEELYAKKVKANIILKKKKMSSLIYETGFKSTDLVSQSCINYKREIIY